ncbi:MAG: FeoB-associated Cys-rich membrane protein [Prevotella sp.]|nr:FeoB-associated Cys-rich membrane protein [Prevotella sp.]
MQAFIVLSCVLLALAYAVWRARKAFIEAKNPCKDCSNCPFASDNSTFRDCKAKKTPKNLAERKKSTNFASAKPRCLG